MCPGWEQLRLLQTFIMCLIMVRGTFHVLIHSISTLDSRRYCYSHFTDEEVESYRHEATCLWGHTALSHASLLQSTCLFMTLCSILKHTHIIQVKVLSGSKNFKWNGSPHYTLAQTPSLSISDMPWANTISKQYTKVFACCQPTGVQSGSLYEVIRQTSWSTGLFSPVPNDPKDPVCVCVTFIWLTEDTTPWALAESDCPDLNY